MKISITPWIAEQHDQFTLSGALFPAPWSVFCPVGEMKGWISALKRPDTDFASVCRRIAPKMHQKYVFCSLFPFLTWHPPPSSFLSLCAMGLHSHTGNSHFPAADSQISRYDFLPCFPQGWARRKRVQGSFLAQKPEQDKPFPQNNSQVMRDIPERFRALPRGSMPPEQSFPWLSGTASLCLLPYPYLISVPVLNQL